MVVCNRVGRYIIRCGHGLARIYFFVRPDITPEKEAGFSKEDVCQEVLSAALIGSSWR